MRIVLQRFAYGAPWSLTQREQIITYAPSDSTLLQ
jgi:hypothetical protein